MSPLARAAWSDVLTLLADVLGLLGLWVGIVLLFWIAEVVR